MATKGKKAGLSRKAIALLRRVEKRILEEPMRLDMEAWVQRVSGPVGEVPACGTTACIAGWIALDGKSARALKHMGFRDATRWNEQAREVALTKLGIPAFHDDPLDNRGGYTGGALFYTGNWPVKYSQSYADASSDRMRARVAVRRIEHFIRTGE